MGKCPNGFNGDNAWGPCVHCGELLEDHEAYDTIETAYDDMKALMDEGIPFSAIWTAAELLGSL